MSTKTEHLGLHQWEPNDPFLREEFNEDFAKIDEGSLRIIQGEFLGDGAAERFISLGRRAKFVVIFGKYATGSGRVNTLDFVTEAITVQITAADGIYTYAPNTACAALTDDGFKLIGRSDNPAGAEIRYVAFC